MALTLNEVCQILNDLVDAGYGDCRVYARDYLVRDDYDIQIETISGVDYVCIGES